MKHIFCPGRFPKILSAVVHTLPLSETDVDFDMEHFSENANASTGSWFNGLKDRGETNQMRFHVGKTSARFTRNGNGENGFKKIKWRMK